MTLNDIKFATWDMINKCVMATVDDETDNTIGRIIVIETTDPLYADIVEKFQINIE